MTFTRISPEIFLLEHERSRMTSDGEPFELFKSYVTWLCHLRNNQMATLTGAELNGVPNFVFDALAQYEEVISAVMEHRKRDSASTWLKLLIRSQQLGFSAFHLAMGGALQDAGALMRLAIETLAYSLKMEHKPFSEEIWKVKDDSAELNGAFKHLFRKKPKSELFHTIPNLYDHFCYWSDYSAHPTFEILNLHSDENFVMAQIEDPNTIRVFLTRLCCSYMQMSTACLALLLGNEGSFVFDKGRQFRLSLYEKSCKDLKWTRQEID